MYGLLLLSLLLYTKFDVKLNTEYQDFDKTKQIVRRELK